MESDEKLWNYENVAEYLNCGIDKVRKDVMLRRIPFIKIGGRPGSRGGGVRFVQNDIKNWIRNQTIQPKAS